MGAMGAERITVGSVEIVSLADAIGPLKMAPEQIVAGVTKERLAPYIKRYPEAFDDMGRWVAPIGSFLLRAGGRTVLVDTGLGPNKWPMLIADEYGRLPVELRRIGVEPAAIDTVFLTHMHGDHVGWNAAKDGTPTFPKARYLLQRADWEYANDPQLLARNPNAATPLRPLFERGLLDLLEGEAQIAPELTALPTPGHTPGHTSLLVVSGGERAVITGDVISNPAQIHEPDWQPVFDRDGDEAAATRRALLDRIEAEGMTVAAGHFPAPGFGRVLRLDGQRYWQAR
jgi:glyoxylase-like metal-dependent hydrolase (beta-lactamase superfamily II)